MTNITIDDHYCHIITDDLELSKKLIMKNPSAKTMVTGNITELVYPADETNTITSILKTKRKN
jgi:hypothetical protein